MFAAGRPAVSPADGADVRASSGTLAGAADALTGDGAGTGAGTPSIFAYFYRGPGINTGAGPLVPSDEALRGSDKKVHQGESAAIPASIARHLARTHYDDLQRMAEVFGGPAIEWRNSAEQILRAA